MDKTPKYQKMCVEAFKDIGYIKPTTSSNLMIPAPNSIQGQQADDFMLSFEDEFDNIGLGSTVARPIGQLYQQDQLQEIIDQDYLTGFIYDLYEFSKEYLYMDNGNDLRFTSMEQLWLGYIMKQIYGKIWNDKELKWTHI